MRRLLSRARKPSKTFDFVEELGGYEPPSFPSLVSHALDLLTDADIDMGKVSAVIELDPGVSARMLRLVNSAWMAPRSTITSVHQAAMMLGRNQLEALLISVGTGSVLPHPACEHYEHHRFWSTAAKRATLASLLAQRVDPTRRSENFTAALLQDMAIPVLALNAATYDAILGQWHNSSEDLTNLEVGSFGWHHGDVAAWMSSNWGFPCELVDFMRSHHEGSEPALRPAHVASAIREVDVSGDDFTVEYGSTVLGLPTDEMVALINQAEVEAADLARMLL